MHSSCSSGSCSDSIDVADDAPIARLCSNRRRGRRRRARRGRRTRHGGGDSQGWQANDARRRFAPRRATSPVGCSRIPMARRANKSSDKARAPDTGAARPPWPDGFDREGAPRPSAGPQPLRRRSCPGATDGRADRRGDDGRCRLHVVPRTGQADGGADRCRNRAARQGRPRSHRVRLRRLDRPTALRP